MNEAVPGWEEVLGGPSPRFGGQGHVRKVRNAQTGDYGALKTLHESHLKSTERRYRVVQEVIALRRLAGAGVPKVLDDNVSQWEKPGVPLYAVLDWIDGPTLADFVAGKPRPLDEALGMTLELLETLERCHNAGIQHRDIKPDNLVVATPAEHLILVDFGMAWSRDDTDEAGFKTEAGQELGNRFLRLPEFAPGTTLRDPRSDVTLAAGILLYMLSGTAPRVLQDSRGRLPHEAAEFPITTTSDLRWSRLMRVFRVAFQIDISQRYASAVELAGALGDLSPLSMPSEDPIAVARARLETLRETRAVKELRDCQSKAHVALAAFLSQLHRLLQPLGFQAGGNGPNNAQDIKAVEVVFYVTPTQGPGPNIHFVHQILFEQNKFTARYSFNGDPDWISYYSGPLADPDTLVERCAAVASTIIVGALDRFTDGVQEQSSEALSNTNPAEESWARSLASALLPVLILSAEVEQRNVDPWLTRMLAEFKTAVGNLREMRIRRELPAEYEAAVTELIMKFDQVSKYRAAIGSGPNLRELVREARDEMLKVFPRIRRFLGRQVNARMRDAVKRADARLSDLLVRGREILFTGASGEFEAEVSRAGADVLVTAYPALDVSEELFNIAHSLHVVETATMYQDGGQSQELLLSRVRELHGQLIGSAMKLPQTMNRDSHNG